MKIHFHIGGGPHHHHRRHSGIRHYGYDRPTSSSDGSGMSIWAALAIFIAISVIFVGVFMFLS